MGGRRRNVLIRGEEEGERRRRRKKKKKKKKRHQNFHEDAKDGSAVALTLLMRIGRRRKGSLAEREHRVRKETNKWEFGHSAVCFDVEAADGLWLRRREEEGGGGGKEDDDEK